MSTKHYEGHKFNTEYITEKDHLNLPKLISLINLNFGYVYESWQLNFDKVIQSIYYSKLIPETTQFNLKNIEFIDRDLKRKYGFNLINSLSIIVALSLFYSPIKVYVDIELDKIIIECEGLFKIFIDEQAFFLPVKDKSISDEEYALQTIQEAVCKVEMIGDPIQEVESLLVTDYIVNYFKNVSIN